MSVCKAFFVGNLLVCYVGLHACVYQHRCESECKQYYPETRVAAEGRQAGRQAGKQAGKQAGDRERGSEGGRCPWVKS